MKKILLGLGILSTFVFAQISDRVNIESYSHNKRIDILKKADNCIHNAKTKEEYKICEKNEKNERILNREELKKMNFKFQKTKILERINNMEIKAKKLKTCVENASSKKELKSCRDNFRKNRK